MRESIMPKQTPAASSIRRKTSLKKVTQEQNPDNRLEIHIFHPTNGLDPEVCEQFNDYTKRMRETFESRMKVLSDLNDQYCIKLALYQSDKQVSDLTAVELVAMAFLRGENPMTIWKEFKHNCTEETLDQLVTEEFDDRIQEIT